MKLIQTLLVTTLFASFSAFSADNVSVIERPQTAGRMFVTKFSDGKNDKSVLVLKTGIDKTDDNISINPNEIHARSSSRFRHSFAGS